MKKLSTISAQLSVIWVIGYCLVPLLAMLASVVFLTGCNSSKSRSPQLEVWDDMRRQEKYKPQQASILFSDGRASRRPPEGTVARGFFKDADVMHTGLEGPALYAGKNPIAIDADLLKLGQTRFNVYCTPCHDRAATGHGIVALKTPTWQPANLHDDRIKQMADGEIFTVISAGRRSMPSYRYQIASEKDRWAIVSYVRALQRMSSGSMEDVPDDVRAALIQSKSQSLLPPPPPPPLPPAGGTPAAVTPAPPTTGVTK